MTNAPDMKSILARVALSHVPPSIKMTLLDESSFREEYGFGIDPILLLNDGIVSVQRSHLFDAVRMILSGESVSEVTDSNGQKWKLENIGEEGQLPKLALIVSEQRLILPDLAALSPDRSTRLRFLNEAASDVNLPINARDAWGNVLSERALQDKEVDTFLDEFRDTPIEKARAIRSEIEEGKINISTLVPHSRRYFERLVGAYDGSASIRDYVGGSGRAILDQIVEWRPYDGFLFSLFLSSHSSITAAINIDQLSSEDLVRAFDFLEKNGDRISQLGAIEIGLRILPTRPDIEPGLIRLVKQICDDDVDGQASSFNLLSALFMFVDGELSRTRLLSTEPPFYRRLAALSQAALIHRQLLNVSVDIDQFGKWAFNNFAEQFYLQSLADMRLEPRWNPNLADAVQMKQEFFGRIIIAAKNHEKNIKNGELFDLVLTSKPGSILSLGDLLCPYLPGPLEGAEEPQNILPTEIAEMIEAHLSVKDVEPSAFIALVNSALIFRVGADQAALAARVLKQGNYRLVHLEDKSQLIAVLNGLATVTAVARSSTLANELRFLVRNYRRDAQYPLSIEEAIYICLVAAASHADMDDWREYIGDGITELAFSNFEGNEGQVLHSHLRCLCLAAPELWVSCGRADAALIAYNSSRRYV